MTNIIAYIIALTIWCEARGEQATGMDAVGTVIWNRAERSGRGFVYVCQRPKQFSVWNEDGYAAKMYARKQEGYGPEWDIAKGIAAKMLDGTFRPAGPWTHHHVKTINPYWSKGMKDVTIIGNHKFGVTK